MEVLCIRPGNDSRWHEAHRPMPREPQLQTAVAAIGSCFSGVFVAGNPDCPEVAWFVRYRLCGKEGYFMKSENVETHQRVQESILAPAEAASLRWFAQRMPSRINSDHLTLIGLVAMLLAGLFYYLSQWNVLLLHIVNLMILANWFGDSLDGTLARFRNRLRPRYGYYVDHILDNFGVLFVTTGLALAGYMSVWVASAVLVVYLLLNINIYLATSTIGVFQISYWKFGPTELRLFLMIGNIFLIYKPVVSLFGQQFLLYDVGGTVAAAMMLTILVVSTAANTRKLYCMERL